MKKTIFTLLILVSVLAVNAQYAVRSGGNAHAVKAINPGVVITQSDKAIGDTLLYCDGYRWYPNTADAPSFEILTEDIDQLITHNTSFFASFGSFYDTAYRADWWMPWDVDTAWYYAATSWFDPAGQADNWLEFGPVTLPAGAELSWYQRYNGSGGTAPFWFDGYEVLITKTWSDFTSFMDPAVFTRDDYTGTDGTDSSWMLQTVTIPATYANQPCWFAFHHNANDMDVLYIDEIKIVEATAGINENTNSIMNVRNNPNPANQYTDIYYQLNSSGNVVIQVTDITGRVVISKEIGTQKSGSYKYSLNTTELRPGVYFYVLNVNNQKMVNKMIVER